MPDAGTAQAPATDQPAFSGRKGRTQVLAFVTDAESEAVLRLGLAAVGSEEVIVHRGNSRSAISVMKKTPTPRVLVVDISGDEQRCRR